MRFLGNIEAKLDTKGRVFLPATFRKVLQATGEEGLVVRRDAFESCLTIYPETVWNRMVDALRRRLNRWDAHDQRILRQFMEAATLLTLDGNGRLLIPRQQLAAVGIEQDVRFIGMDDCIELWANDSKEQAALPADDFAAALQAAMAVHPATPTTEQ